MVNRSSKAQLACFAGRIPALFFVLAIGLLCGCQSGPLFESKPVPLEIPEFSVAQVLASADEQTKRALKNKAAVRVSEVLNQQAFFDYRLEYLGGSTFEITFRSAPGRQRIDLGTYSMIRATDLYYGHHDYGMAEVILQYADEEKFIIARFSDAGMYLGSKIPRGGKKEALEFIEACEVLGVKIVRDKEAVSPSKI